ncbi:MAG: peptidoglycan DD-metalloendopeptidase family protein [Acidovorax sp.]|jgi:lipoprotein NlpD|nr:peptidoglycan DD-metalloendopeptidase family protein [Acidovorax sp.]
MWCVRGLGFWSSVAVAAAVLSGCASSGHKAPVEDRGPSSRASSGAVPGQVVEAAPALPGAENAGKPGYYTVKPGDALIRIGLENGQSWKDIARWNNLENPNLIEVGQVLRVVPPSQVATVVVGSDSATTSRPVTTATPAPVATSPAASSGGGSVSDDGLGFMWPATGPLLAGFDEARNKGYDIGGKAGDPVLAAADGRVVYAGAGLRGYGNLVILKHNNTFLTAYAHNQTLLVKEDQSVRKGQKIAEMGSTDADRVKLHFEIRRQGKPVDPARYLPSR